MKVRRFIKNAAILTATSLILRLIGMLFRVYLANTVGSEGMGLYQMIFSLYILSATFAGGGITTAVTRLITDRIDSGQSDGARIILARAILLTLAASAASMVALICCKDYIAVHWIKDSRAAPSLQIMAFSLPFMGVCACIKGYFIAHRSVYAPSLSQLTEQVVRIAVIMLIFAFAAPGGIEFACAAVLFGDTVAEAAGCLYIYISYVVFKRRAATPVSKSAPSNTSVTKQLLRIAAPITAGAYLNSVLRTFENLLVPAKLTEYNSSRRLSVSSFGALKGMALPLVFFPASFLSALSTLLVPELSGAKAAGDIRTVKSAVTKSVSITLSASMITACIFFVFNEDIGLAVYSDRDAALYLKYLAPMIPLMYLESIVNGMLHGLDQQMSSFRYNMLDSVSRIALIYVLLPRFGMAGFIAVMAVSNLLTSLLCLLRLLKVTEIKPDVVNWLIKPLALSLGAVTVALAVSRVLPDMGALPRAITECAAALAVYLPSMALANADRLRVRIVRHVNTAK